MLTESPYQLIERILVFRESGKLSRDERDLLADACNMISGLHHKLAEAKKSEAA